MEWPRTARVGVRSVRAIMSSASVRNAWPTSRRPSAGSSPPSWAAMSASTTSPRLAFTCPSRANSSRSRAIIVRRPRRSTASRSYSPDHPQLRFWSASVPAPSTTHGPRRGIRCSGSCADGTTLIRRFVYREYTRDCFTRLGQAPCATPGRGPPVRWRPVVTTAAAPRRLHGRTHWCEPAVVRAVRPSVARKGPHLACRGRSATLARSRARRTPDGRVRSSQAERLRRPRRHEHRAQARPPP